MNSHCFLGAFDPEMSVSVCRLITCKKPASNEVNDHCFPESADRCYIHIEFSFVIVHFCFLPCFLQSKGGGRIERFRLHFSNRSPSDQTNISASSLSCLRFLIYSLITSASMLPNAAVKSPPYSQSMVLSPVLGGGLTSGPSFTRTV